MRVTARQYPCGWRLTFRSRRTATPPLNSSVRRPMKFTGWLIAILLLPFVAILAIMQPVDGFSLGYTIADGILLGCYYLIYLFYGPRREGTLRHWIPFKTKVGPVFMRIFILFGAGACAYYAATAMVSHDCTAFGPASSTHWRWVGVFLQSTCNSFGPVIPSAILFIAGIYGVYLVLARRRLPAPNHSSKRTR